MGLDGDTLAPMETDEPTAGTSDPKTKSKLTPAMATRIKQIKPLLSASSRLGRALAELFGLLVKLCVGSPVRQRRSHHATSTGTAPTPAARATASSLTKLLTKGGGLSATIQYEYWGGYQLLYSMSTGGLSATIQYE
uniref:Uncharacterized protein n=1 Tax=Hucho hucho TaxID=62062 RepID=A0A4W5JEP4_9TELE